MKIKGYEFIAEIFVCPLKLDNGVTEWVDIGKDAKFVSMNDAVYVQEHDGEDYKETTLIAKFLEINPKVFNRIL